MFSLQKNSLLILLFFSVIKAAFANANTDFYIYGTYEKSGVKIKYNAVINSTLSGKSKNLILQLNTFNIEQATYNKKTYRNNDIFGISFPIDAAVALEANVQLSQEGVSSLNNKVLTLNSIEPTIISLNSATNNTNLKLHINEIISIIALFKNEVFIEKIKANIQLNVDTISKSDRDKEYTRLNILANNYLLQNNYQQAKITFTKAKEYANTKQIKKIDKQIAITNTFLKNETDNSNTTTINNDNDLSTTTSVKKETTNTEIKVLENSTSVKETTNVISEKVIIENSILKEDKLKKTDAIPEKAKDLIAVTTTRTTTTTTSSSIKENNNISPNKDNYELIKTAKGYIKYKRDEESVEDSQGNTLIPYGKYKIIRYKAGFAQVKLTDDVVLKNIVCTNKNNEYTWSARIYENPWLETVIDKEVNYVKALEKKVEIYIVDNINYRPFNELPRALVENYQDPNPYEGTQQITAFNLWNRDNANKPWVKQRRKEIEKAKRLSKNDAYKGVDICRSEVSERFEEVYNYYKNMGYEVILRE